MKNKRVRWFAAMPSNNRLVSRRSEPKKPRPRLNAKKFSKSSQSKKNAEELNKNTSKTSETICNSRNQRSKLARRRWRTYLSARRLSKSY